MTMKKYNPRNTGKIGKKRSEAFKKAQSKRLRGIPKSPATIRKMQRAAQLRWQNPEYRAQHSQIMRSRWASVHEAQKLLTPKSSKLKSQKKACETCPTATPKINPKI